MGLKRTHWMLVAAVGGLATVLALTGARLAGPAFGGDTTVRVDSPATVSLHDSVPVGIDIDHVADLGAYEWVLTYDPTILVLAGDPVNGTFLGSTGRSVFCPDPILDEGTVRLGCVSSGTTGGPSGPGVLSTLTFTARASGSTSLCLSWVQLSDSLGNDIPISPGQVQQPSSCPAAATPTPFATATPGEPYVLTPVATATPGGPLAATATPQGPTPTPAPTPPPESAEVMDLIAGCNPITTTYPDGTTVQTLTAATAPAGTLDAIWRFDAGVWRAYSPEFPQASDLAVTAFLDVVFLCVDAPATFVRPLV